MNINQLCDRYSLKSRQSIYDWCKALNVKLSRDDDNKSYAPPELIKLFDQLAEHLKGGNSIKSFTPLVKTTVSQPLDNVSSSLDTVNFPLDNVSSSLDTINFPLDNVSRSLDTITESSHNSDLVDLVNAIAAVIKPNPGLSRHEELEKAVANGWILSTSELDSIGFKPYCKTGEDYCDRGCWRFVKAGKIGRESAWSVQKITKG
jgi:hypothetical protein